MNLWDYTDKELHKKAQQEGNTLALEIIERMEEVIESMEEEEPDVYNDAFREGYEADLNECINPLQSL